MSHNLRKLEKMLVAMLSLCPDVYGLVLDENGWISLKQIHRAVFQEESLSYITPAFLRQYFLLNPDRYELKNHMVRRRDYKGIFLRPIEFPPSMLYFGISLNSYSWVKSEGVQKTSQRVVLFSTEELALSVAKRKTSSCILLRVKTDKAMDMGCRFYVYGESNCVYLSDYIPPDAIIFPPLPAENPRATKAKIHSSSSLRNSKNSVTIRDKRLDISGSFFLPPSRMDGFESGLKGPCVHKGRDKDWKRERRKNRKRDLFDPFD